VPVLIGKRTLLALKVMNTIFFAVSVLALPYPYGITFGAVKKEREAHLARDLCHFRLRDTFSLEFYFHLFGLLFITTSVSITHLDLYGLVSIRALLIFNTDGGTTCNYVAVKNRNYALA